MTDQHSLRSPFRLAAGGRRTTTRADVVDAVAAALDAADIRWAWRGPASAPDTWSLRTGPAGLGIWCDTTPERALTALRGAVGGAVVARATGPGRRRHVGLAVPTATGRALLDVTLGDLMVGPVLLVPAVEVTLDAHVAALTGKAAASDLVVEPLLRGRRPVGPRLAEGRRAWRALPEGTRHDLIREVRAQMGARFSERLAAVLDGWEKPDRALARSGRGGLARQVLRRRASAATRGRERVAALRPGPLGLRARGVVVAVVGADPGGASTVARDLTLWLTDDGWCNRTVRLDAVAGTSPARPAWPFGPAEPPDAALEASGPVPDDAADAGFRSASDGFAPARSADDRRGPEGQGPFRTTPWAQAADHIWRYLRQVAPHLLLGRVVISDRWALDTRSAPWAGSSAARVVERLVPRPDVVVLADTPVEVVHDREPRWSLAEQLDRREAARALLAERPARYAEVVVNLSGGEADPLAEATDRVWEAAHLPGRADRFRDG